MNRSQLLHQTLYDLLPMIPNELIALSVQYASSYQIVMSGGQNAKHNSLYSCVAYDVDTNEWHSFPDMSDPRRFHCMVATPSGDLYVLGGWNERNRSLKTMERFDRQGNRWIRERDLPDIKNWSAAICVPSSSLLDPKEDAVSLLNSHSCIVINGGERDWTGSWCIDLDTKKGRPVLGQMSIERRGHGFVLAPNGKFYALRAPQYQDLEKCEAFDPCTGVWSKMSDIPTKLVISEFALGCDGKIYVFGIVAGFSLEHRAECYDPNTDTWTRIPDPPALNDDFACVSCPNGKIYLLGVHSNGGSTSCFSFDVFTRTYSRIQDLPEPRIFGKAVICCF